MSNLKAAPVDASAIAVELSKACGRPVGLSTENHGLGTATEYRAQADEYSLFALDPLLSWPSRIRLTRAAVALRIAADLMDGNAN